MKSKTIDLNGIRYDAVTGARIASGVATQTTSGSNIDGFFRGRATVTSATGLTKGKLTELAQAKAQKFSASRAINHVKAHTPQSTASVTLRQPKPTGKLHTITVQHHASQPNHVKHRVAQGSVTLMRKAVKRPAPSFHKQAHPQAALQHAVPSLITSKPAASTVDVGRLTRAKQVSRSPQISRHNATKSSPVPQFTPLPVQPAPVAANHTAPSRPANEKPADIFEHAIANAAHYIDVKSHSRLYKKHVRNHALSMAAGVLALVVIAGFAAYQNTPGLQFKVASAHAGLATHLPNFKAAGFAYNGVTGNKDKLTVGFSSVQGTYQMTQQPTNLSGADMIDTVGSTDATGRPAYKTVNAGKTTIYRFSNTDATWVQNGTWYSVSGSSSLSDQQVKSLAQNV